MMTLLDAIRKADPGKDLSVLLSDGSRLRCRFETLMFEDEDASFCVRVLDKEGKAPEREETVEAVLSVEDGEFPPGSLLELRESDVVQIDGEPVAAAPVKRGKGEQT
jgi:hypothetical protein